jgi:hypothetical protein
MGVRTRVFEQEQERLEMKQLENTRHISHWALLAVFTIVVTMGVDYSNNTNTSSTGGVAASYDALAGRLNDCEKTAQDCTTQANGDATALAVCQSQLQACSAQAKVDLDALKAEIKACVDTAKSCVQTDAGADTRKLCGQQLHDCVQSNLPAPPQMPPCFAQLQQCAQNSGGAPQSCASQAHQCILANLPHHGAGLWHDDDDADGGEPDDHGAAADGGCKDRRQSQGAPSAGGFPGQGAAGQGAPAGGFPGIPAVDAGVGGFMPGQGGPGVPAVDAGMGMGGFPRRR